MSDEITMRREWAMPSKATFEIKPIKELIERELSLSEGLWIDPYSGGKQYADYTNDLNPDVDSDYTMDAVEFLQGFEDDSVNGGVLFDPPYSPRQIKEVYDSIGHETTMETTQATFWSKAKAEIARICTDGATVITCGWNSGGIGKTNNFQKREILLVAHGGWHNDTICVVEDYGYDKKTSDYSEIGEWNGNNRTLTEWSE